MTSSLIINADDFGLTKGINRAIAELHHANALTSATLMATGPAFDLCKIFGLKVYDRNILLHPIKDSRTSYPSYLYG